MPLAAALATCAARATRAAFTAASPPDAPIVTASFTASAIAAAISSTPWTSIAIATATFGAIPTLFASVTAVASARHVP